MKPITLFSLTCLLLLPSAFAKSQATTSPIYLDDPEIVSQIKSMADNQSIYLPLVKIKGKVLSPRHRDFSNKMPYASDRETAMYAGGSHQTYRANDVWEFHLGSNRWHRLFAPDGGNHAFLKYTLYSGAMKKWRKKPGAKLNNKEQEKFVQAKTWWQKNVIFKDGHITTSKGGPIMPSHTWDGFTYDSKLKKLIWGNGAHPGGSAFYHAMFTDQNFQQVKLQFDRQYTPMWMFDPVKKSWLQYKTNKQHPAFRGMGGAMQYLPDLDKTIWYMAAKNVNPNAFEMWMFDAQTDSWTALRPNGGRSIQSLATSGESPMAEQQFAYAQQQQTLVAVEGHNTYGYDVKNNLWQRLVNDHRIVAHDAKSVFAYDQANSVFLLANPKHKNQLAAFSIKSGKWQLLSPDGPAVPNRRYGPPRGYYDPKYNVFVIDDSKGRVWLYRYKNTKN